MGDVELGSEVAVFRLWTRVYRYTLGVLCDVEAAEDVTQEAFVRLLANARKAPLSNVHHPYPYLIGIVRHILVDTRRAAARQVALEPLLTSMDWPHPEPEHDSSFNNADVDRRVGLALGRLPATDRQLLLTCFYEGLTSAEIARQLGVPDQRIRQRKHRALKRIRAQFDSPG